MASLHLPPSAGTASSDSTSSNPRYTPVSNSDEDTPMSRPGKSPAGQLKLQTDFGDSVGVGGPVEEGDEEQGYESGEELEAKTRTAGAPKYTLAEEREVVRSFDRRLVPFLALLYLLSFLDRSSTSRYSSPCGVC